MGGVQSIEILTNAELIADDLPELRSDILPAHRRNPAFKSLFHYVT